MIATRIEALRIQPYDMEVIVVKVEKRIKKLLEMNKSQKFFRSDLKKLLGIEYLSQLRNKKNNKLNYSRSSMINFLNESAFEDNKSQ